MADIAQHVEAFRPGENSTVYPCGITNSASSHIGKVGGGESDLR
jgi:cysteinyl-tRNA synthetase